jgi:hypothetical protein
MTKTKTVNGTDDNNDKKGHFMVFHCLRQEQMLNPQPQLWKEEVLKIAGLTQENYPRNFRAVALVFASSPEEVYQLTNHIGTSWQHNPEVVSFTRTPQRSTSVGDVILRVGVLDEKEEEELHTKFKDETAQDTAFRVTLNRAVMVNHYGFLPLD